MSKTETKDDMNIEKYKIQNLRAQLNCHDYHVSVKI